MANHEANVLAHDLVGHRHGLLGLAGVVHQYHFELVAAGTARGIDLFDGGQGTGLDHIAVLGDRAAHGAGDGDLDGFGVGQAGGSEAGGGNHGGHGSGRKTGQRHQELLDYVWVIPGRGGMTSAIEQHPRGEPPEVAEGRPEAEDGPAMKT
ncbi:hypothetical protein D3C81_1700250 [compost metagenome]